MKEGISVSQIDYFQLRNEIDSVAPDEMADILKKAGFVHVAIDPEMHEFEPSSDRQRLTWETLDTAWNLLRETAVRIALTEVREQLAEQGFTNMPTDEQLFERAREEGVGATSYLDLAPQTGDGGMADLAAEGLYGVLAMLSEAAYQEARTGMAAAQEAE